MNKKRLIIIGLVVFVLTLASGINVYLNLPNLPGAIEESDIDIENLTQVVVPGSGMVNFEKPGAYAVYYEYRSEYSGVRYLGSEDPPQFDCELVLPSSKLVVEPVLDYMATNRYSTKDLERVGYQIMSLTIDQPGVYEFSCDLIDFEASEKLILAVGPHFTWEFINIFVKLGLSFLTAGLVCSLGFFIIIACVIFYLIKRFSEAPN